MIRWITFLFLAVLSFTGFTQKPVNKEIKYKDGFSFEGSVFGDIARNFTGGSQQHFAYLGIIDISIKFETEKAGLWKGGELFLQVENTHGASPTRDYVRDYQTFSNAEAGTDATSNTCLYQLYYKQSFGKFSILLGQHDLNSDFVASDYGGTFINSSFGIMPSVSSNLSTSIFPVTTLAAMIHVEPDDRFSFKAAIYDGDPGSPEENEHSTQWKLSKEEGFLGITELQYNSVRGEQIRGSYKLGYYYHSGMFADQTDAENSVKGNYGAYFIADQIIKSEKKDKDQGLGAFVMIGYAPRRQNFEDFFLGGGLHYKGLIRGRDEDDLAVAFGHASFNNELIKNMQGTLLNHETVIEITYKAVLGEHFEIQPDLQYILNTGGEEELGNSFIGLIRVSIGF